MTKIDKFINELDELEALYDVAPSNFLFTLLLLLNDKPLDEEEAIHLLAMIGRGFHNHREKDKVLSLIKKIKYLRQESKDNEELAALIQNKVTALLSDPQILEYIKRSKNISDKNIRGM